MWSGSGRDAARWMACGMAVAVVTVVVRSNVPRLDSYVN